MIMIGERVNATRRSIREAIQARDTACIHAEIVRQDEAGARYIDLNAGTGSGERGQEIDDLCWLVDVAVEATEKDLTLDAADSAVIAAAAEHLAGRRNWMLNSVNGEDDSLGTGLDLAAKHGVPVVALAMDADGIPKDSEARIAICARIRAEATRRGVPDKDLFFDPLVMPVAADIGQPTVTMETLRGIKSRWPEVRTTVGLSNVSHGLKKRSAVNGAFLIAALANGLDSAICDPGNEQIRTCALLGDMLMGRDRHCRRFSRAVRKGLFD